MGREIIGQKITGTNLKVFTYGHGLVDNYVPMLKGRQLKGQNPYIKNMYRYFYLPIYLTGGNTFYPSADLSVDNKGPQELERAVGFYIDFGKNVKLCQFRQSAPPARDVSIKAERILEIVSPKLC